MEVCQKELRRIPVSAALAKKTLKDRCLNQLESEHRNMQEQFTVHKGAFLGHVTYSALLTSQSVTTSLDPLTLIRVDFFSSW